ncbi:MAG: glycosyltransferase family 4 protein [Flavobacteriales bacterium]|jgi:glycosyltransferase involved in cell wall biosynthesis|nr:glycosyltransferase family 4 protein [Flavobacteriales bacterium]
MAATNKTIALLVFNNFKNDSRVLKEALSLSKAGYNVEVIAHHDKGLEKEEKIGEVTVKRVSYLDRTTAGTFTKIIAYIQFIFAALKQTKNADFLHCNDLNTLPIGYLAKKVYRRTVKIVYDAHEYETEVNHLKGFKQQLIKFEERQLIKHADATITVSDAIAKEYKKLYPNIDTPRLVLNCPNYKKIENQDLFRKHFNLPEDVTIFLFQGNLSKGRGIELTIEAFKNVSDKKNVIVFMGYGNLENLIKQTAQEESNIFFHEAVPQKNLLNYTTSADFGILFYENSCLNHYYCSPNKMFEYIMAEIPVIISNLYEMKKIINQYKVGVIAEENTPEGLIEAIKKASLLDRAETHQNLLQTKQIYNWENQEKELVEIYHTLDANK